MKANWIDFFKGVGFGFVVTSMLFTSFGHIRDNATIKQYVDGKIECATIGGDFICRELNK